MKTILVPFTGFYETIHEQGFIDALEELEDSSNLTDHDFQDYKDAYAKKYLVIVQEKLSDAGIHISLEFKKVVSPEQYNYETDVILALISTEDIRLLYKKHDPQQLDSYITDTFTSRPGFHSYYSNNVKEWHEKGFGEWDCVELGSLLQTLIDETYLYYEDAEELAREIISN